MFNISIPALLHKKNDKLVAAANKPPPPFSSPARPPNSLSADIYTLISFIPSKARVKNSTTFLKN